MACYHRELCAAVSGAGTAPLLMTSPIPSALDRVVARTSPHIPTLAVVCVAIALGGVSVFTPLLGVAAAAALLTGVAILAYPHGAAPLVAFLLYSNLAAVAVRYHGVPRPLAAGTSLLLAVPVAYRVLLRRERLVVQPVVPLLMLLGVVQLCGVLFARQPADAASGLIALLVEGLGFFLLFTNAVRDEGVLRRTIWALLLAGLLIGAVPTFQRLTGTFYNDYGGLAQVNTTVGTPSTLASIARAGGPIGDENRFAQVMLMLLPLGVLCIVNERGKRRWLALVATSLTASGFALAASRGGAVGLALVLALLPALGLLSLRKLSWIVLGLLVLAVATPQYRNRLASIANLPHLFGQGLTEEQEPDGAMKGRATEMLAAAHVFLDHPLIGVGPGMFPLYSQEYGNRLGLRRLETNRESHSLYLGIAAENGALGLGLFLWIGGLTLVRLARARRRCAQLRPELANTAAAVLVALLLYFATGVFLHFSFQRYFFLMLALAWSVIFVCDKALAAPHETAPTERP